MINWFRRQAAPLPPLADVPSYQITVLPPSSPMHEVVQALINVKDAQAALHRGEQCWNANQLEDALKSAEFFIKKAKLALAAGVTKNQKKDES